MIAARRVALAVLVAGFAFGTLTHAIDLVRAGGWPYRFGPPVLNLFWNALVLLDALVVTLLVLGRRRVGVLLGIAVMVADVAANTYAWRWLGMDAFATSVPVQAAFLGYLLGAAGLLLSPPSRLG